IQLPYALPRQSLQISASVGIAIHPEHGNNANQLVRYADTAMYAAKRLGGNRCHLFFERMLTGGLGEGL
ncbi:MAG TPA: diguanylate cyclase, partial [Rhodocyclaceae bacterium]|nr:diguanylate cyclase [Rhodocyclaceae bacterium]